MNILVCVKQVPQSVSSGFDPVTNTINRDGDNEMNPADVYALETALELRDRHDGEVTVITMGKRSASALLIQAATLGADNLYLINDEIYAGSDTYVTAMILAKAISSLPEFDLIICGRRAIDGETGQVGPQLSVIFEIPCATNIDGIIQTSAEKIVCRRLTEFGHETLEIDYPALITVCEGVENIPHPRLASLMGMRKAKNATINKLTNEQLMLDSASVGLTGSPTKVEHVSHMIRESKNCVPELNIDKSVEHIIQMISEGIK